MSNNQVYHVFHAPEGGAQSYLGSAENMEQARRMVSDHECGELYALEEVLYETARQAGHCAGIKAPPKVGEPVEWLGTDGYHYVARAV